jgi:hypothetical protein
VDDNRGVMLAFGLILLWVAGVCFFAAFHPGGVTNSDGNPAQNPADVLKWLLTKAGEGSATPEGSNKDASVQTT